MPQQPSYSLRNLKLVSSVVLAGSYIVVIVISALLLISLGMNNDFALGRLVICAFAFAYIIATQLLMKRRLYHLVAYMLLAFYTILATDITWSWGINTPIALLIFGLVIVLAGILLTARHSLYAALVSAALLIGLQLAIVCRWHMPDVSWTRSESSFGDVSAYCIVFAMLALVSWLYNREMESSLQQAHAAHFAIQQQKITLEKQVKKRTQQLRKAQLEDLQQMYRFAELGQMGVTMLHELANHLTALMLEIEGIQNKQHSKAIARAQTITHYLERIVDNTRDRLHGASQSKVFDVSQMTGEVVEFLQYKAVKAKVKIEWLPPEGSWKYIGDSISLSQVIAIIASNAIDAYGSPHKPLLTDDRRLAINLYQTKKYIVIKISNWGPGIPKDSRNLLFKPFYSRKKTGFGIGLFIARQTVQTTFSGTIKLNLHSDHTEFIIKLGKKA